MSVFEAIHLTWNGKDYTIPPDNVLQAIAKIEDVLTLGQIATFINDGKLPLAKLAICTARLLRHAGVEVRDEAVYAAMFSGAGRELQQRALGWAMTLYRMMIPPEALRSEPGKEPGKDAATDQTAGPSPSATSSSSAAAG